MATVIKAGEAGKVVRRLTTVDLADHLREAQSVIAAARLRADAMIREAAGQAESIREKAHREGYQAGFDSGTTQGRSEGFAAARAEVLESFTRDQTSLVTALARAISEFEGMKLELELAARRDVLEFAAALAQKLTFAIGHASPDAAKENLRRALELVGRQTDLSIRLHPQDYAALEMYAPQLAQEISAARHVRLEADDAIAPGGCMVKSPTCAVDATLETQLEEMLPLLLGHRAPGAHPGGEEASDD